MLQNRMICNYVKMKVHVKVILIFKNKFNMFIWGQINLIIYQCMF